MSVENSRAYLLVVIQPGNEQEFANEIISKGLSPDPKAEKVDFVHGSYDSKVTLAGKTRQIDPRILKIRELPYVRRTETLVPFEMLNWQDAATSS